MTDETRSRFRNELLGLRDDLLSQLAQDDPASESITPDSAIGRLTRMDAIQSQSMSAEGRRRQEARLRKVERAVERIDDGTYGTCTRCGSEIPMGRLEIMPEVGLCVNCSARGRA